MKCAECRFFDKMGMTHCNWGVCRRNAPSGSFVGTNLEQMKVLWPIVRENDWCGDYQPKQ